ncbi:MAG: phosphotransferase [Sedimentisphaerales bacterium]|nr:phosphotransferase [Sedimentisphaerales bacterium]
MSKGGAHFTSQELALVLSNYDIGIIQQIKPLVAGNRRAPKQIIISDTGRYLLKRRAKGKDDRYRVAFAHAVQQCLQKKNFPVSRLISTKENNTFLELDNHTYELFEFVTGIRFGGQLESVIDAGAVLGKFHVFLSDFSYQQMPIRGTFHDSRSIRGYLKKISAEEKSKEIADKVSRKMIKSLMTMYNSSSVNVNQLGFDNWTEQIIHGDWHPGNMLFSNGKIVAILDFDSLKVSNIVTDLANGALQFSIVGGRPNPADWPDYLDQSKLAHFISSYYEVNRFENDQLKTLPDLMIETLIAEAVIPIATIGSFINLPNADFLNMIHRKCSWIDKNRDAILKSIEHSLQDLSK